MVPCSEFSVPTNDLLSRSLHIFFLFGAYWGGMVFFELLVHVPQRNRRKIVLTKQHHKRFVAEAHLSGCYSYCRILWRFGSTSFGIRESLALLPSFRCQTKLSRLYLVHQNFMNCEGKQKRHCSLFGTPLLFQCKGPLMLFSFGKLQ